MPRPSESPSAGQGKTGLRQWTRERASIVRTVLGVLVELNGAVDHRLSGVRVDAVEQDSPAAMTGLKEGDRIIEVSNQRVARKEDLADALETLERGQKCSIRWVRVRNDLEETSTSAFIAGKNISKPKTSQLLYR